MLKFTLVFYYYTNPSRGNQSYYLGYKGIKKKEDYKGKDFLTEIN